MDVVADGSRSEKLEALRVVYRKYEARLSTVLKRALQDPDTSVRVLAATVTAKLHATYSQKIGDCQIGAAANPKLARTGRPSPRPGLPMPKAAYSNPRGRARKSNSLLRDLSHAVELDPADANFGRSSRQGAPALAAWRTGFCFGHVKHRPSISGLRDYERWR